MRTLKFLSALLILTLISRELIAKDNKNQNQQSVKSQIRKEITYPQLAVENQIEGSVVVQYKVSEEGKIVIEKINYENVILGDYVKEKLSKIDLDKSFVTNSESQLIRFDFKLQ